MTRSQVLRAALVVVLAAAGLAWMNSFAPLQWPSVLAYSGIVLIICGGLSILAPSRWLGFSKRIHGLALGVLLGALLLAAGTFWPARSLATASTASRLDVVMPTYNFHERHELIVQASPARVREALDQVSFDDIRVMQTLGRIREIAMGHATRKSAAKGAPPSLPIVQIIQDSRSGFFPLDRTPHEFVFGLAGQPWNNKGVRLAPEEFRTWSAPQSVKIAANFRLEDAGDGRCRIITETRVSATDATARRRMATYWALIYPGSGMIRRSLLNAIRERAERR